MPQSDLFWTMSELPEKNVSATTAWAKYALDMLNSSIEIAKQAVLGLASLRMTTKVGVKGIFISVGLDKQAASLVSMSNATATLLPKIIPADDPLSGIHLALARYTVKSKRYYPDPDRPNTIRYRIEEYNPFLVQQDDTYRYPNAVLMNVRLILQQLDYVLDNDSMKTVGVVGPDAFVTKAGDWPPTGNELTGDSLPTDQKGRTVILTEDAVHQVIGKLLDYANLCYTMMTVEMIEYVKKNPGETLPTLPSPPPTVADVATELPPPDTGTGTKIGVELPEPPPPTTGLTPTGTVAPSERVTGPTTLQVVGALALAAAVGWGTWKLTGAMMERKASSNPGGKTSFEVDVFSASVKTAGKKINSSGWVEYWYQWRSGLKSAWTSRPGVAKSSPLHVTNAREKFRYSLRNEANVRNASKIVDQLDNEVPNPEASSNPVLNYPMVELLKSMNAREWQKGGRHRFYLPLSQSANLIDLKVEYYQSGNVSSAYLAGDKISNASAASILRSLDGIYYDALTDTFYGQSGYLREIVRKLRARATS